MRPPARKSAVAAALAAAVAVLLWQAWPEDAPPEIDQPAAPTDDAADVATGRTNDAGATAPAATGGIGALTSTPNDWTAFLATSSLRGAEIDGEVWLDAAGRLVPDLGLRRLFDQLLSLRGELDPGSIRRLLADLVSRRHGDSVAREVLAVYDRYIDYLAAVADARLGAIADLHERHARARALRREHLGESLAAAFFAADEALAEHTLARIEIARDRSLDAEVRAARLAALDAEAPAAIREARRDATLADLLAEQERQFDALAIDPDTRTAERAALFGVDAAARLAAVDAAEAAWQRRLADYARVTAAIRSDGRLDAAGRAAALEAELARRFDDAEQRRVRSLEAAGLLPDAGP